jgi:quinol monooxygenase YgiN
MAFVVTARWVAKEGHEEEVRMAILCLIEPSRGEVGTLHYQPSRLETDPRVFFFYEEYIDEAAYLAHGASEHFQYYAVGRAIPLLELRERVFYDTLDL